MERDCRSGEVQAEQIKGYQRNPVIARQLIVSSGTKQGHFFCLLIRFALVRSVEPLCLCTRLDEGKRGSGCSDGP